MAFIDTRIEPAMQRSYVESSLAGFEKQPKLGYGTMQHDMITFVCKLSIHWVSDTECARGVSALPT